MSEQAVKLSLLSSKHIVTSWFGINAEQVREDLKEIFVNPTRAGSGVTPGPTNTLYIDSGPIRSRPGFRIGIVQPYYPGKNQLKPDALDIYTRLLYRPEQAAGFAALQMYADSQGMPLGELWARDDDPTACTRFIAVRAAQISGERGKNASNIANVSMLPGGPSSIHPYHTEIKIENQGGLLLPGLVGILKGVVEAVHPDDNASESVGRMFGATSTELLTGAWERIVNDYPDDRVAASRAFFLSEAFDSDPPT